MAIRKSYYVRNIFNNISHKYDFLNNLLSLGLHNLWKKKLINLLMPIDGEIWGDLCCGTGDISFLISKKIAPNGKVFGIDSASEILKIAKLKSEKISDELIKWEKKDIFEIDQLEKLFDGICMSYGLRNLKDIEKGLEKVYVLLKEKGRAGFLDFNHCKDKSLSYFFQKIYLRFIVVPISRIFRLGEEYSYIEKSIREFPDGEKLIKLAKKVGFQSVKYETLFGGQMGILLLKK